MKTSSDRSIIGDVRILTGSSEIAACEHAHCTIQIWQKKQPRTTGAMSGGLQVAMLSQLRRFLVMLLGPTDIIIVGGEFAMEVVIAIIRLFRPEDRKQAQ